MALYRRNQDFFEGFGRSFWIVKCIIHDIESLMFLFSFSFVWCIETKISEKDVFEGSEKIVK